MQKIHRRLPCHGQVQRRLLLKFHQAFASLHSVVIIPVNHVILLSMDLVYLSPTGIHVIWEQYSIYTLSALVYDSFRVTNMRVTARRR